MMYINNKQGYNNLINRTPERANKRGIMRLQERINKLERVVLPEQTQWLWIDSKDDIPNDITNKVLVCWQGVLDEPTK